MANALYYGDNLDVLRHEIGDDSVDLIYLDPPFNSQANYNVLFKSPAGKAADAQIEAFEDTWHWGEEAERAFAEVLASPATQAAELLRAMRSCLGENDAFPGVAFAVHGTPKDLESAIDLARRDKYQFQWWAMSLVDARPYGGKKKGADGGIDGILFFRSDKDKTEKAVISVKGGDNVGVGMVRDLIAVVDREKAAVGVLISLALPTRAMEREAIGAGFFTGPFEAVPKIQIITLAELFQGIRPRIPRIDAAATFRTAARESTAAQGRLL